MPRRRRLSASLFRLSRNVDTAEAIEPGNPRRMARRAQEHLAWSHAATNWALARSLGPISAALRRTYLLLLAAVALAGCGGATRSYSPSVKEAVLHSCEKSAPPKTCRCLLNVLEQHYGEHEAMLWAEAAGRGGAAATSLGLATREAAERCGV